MSRKYPRYSCSVSAAAKAGEVVTLVSAVDDDEGDRFTATQKIVTDRQSGRETKSDRQTAQSSRVTVE